MNPPKEKDTPKEAANELDEILAPVNELIRSVWSDELENLKDEKQAILSLIESEKVKARIEGAMEYNRIVTDELGKPTYMDDEDGRQTVYKQAWVSEAIQEANRQLFKLTKETE